MKRSLAILAACVLTVAMAQAQQDPDDQSLPVPFRLLCDKGGNVRGAQIFAPMPGIITIPIDAERGCPPRQAPQPRPKASAPSRPAKLT